MNQTLSRLSREAHDHAEHITKDFTGDEPVCFMDYYTEKLTELIVKECISKIENEAEQYAAPTWAFEIVNDLKETFGVEE